DLRIIRWRCKIKAVFLPYGLRGSWYISRFILPQQTSVSSLDTEGNIGLDAESVQHIHHPGRELVIGVRTKISHGGYKKISGLLRSIYQHIVATACMIF